MAIPFDRKRIEKAAKDSGIILAFDSQNPGVKYSDGTIKSWEDVTADISSLACIDLSEFDEEPGCTQKEEA